MSRFRFPYARVRHGMPGAETPALLCENVSVQYRGADRPALQHIDLRVESGSRVALIGANGAGKSTLLKAAAGLMPLCGGTIHLHGSRVGGCCHRVAFLAQRGELDWRFPITVHKLVLTGRYVHLGWLARPGLEDHRRVDQTLEQLGIADLAHHRIGRLSGGQQQRALLARAIVQEADLLLLDEPLNAVDTATRTIVRDALRTLSAAGKTIVAATHDLHDIEVEFDRVVHLTGGCCDGSAHRLAEARRAALAENIPLDEAR